MTKTLRDCAYYTVPGGDVVVAFVRGGESDMFLDVDGPDNTPAIAYLQLEESIGWTGVDESLIGQVKGYAVMPDGMVYADVCTGLFEGLNSDSSDPDGWFWVTIDARSTPYQLLRLAGYRGPVQVDLALICDWSFMGPETEVSPAPVFTLADLVEYDHAALAAMLSWLDFGGGAS